MDIDDMEVPPLHYPVGIRKITQFFGANVEWYKEKLGIDGGHNGVDWAVPVGTSVQAADNGKVIEIGDDANGFGRYIKVGHDWGHSIYAHLSEIRVKLNDVVRQGQEIGLSGNSGFSTGPHLHFGIRVKPTDTGPDREWSDPTPYLSVFTPEPPQLHNIGDKLDHIIALLQDISAKFDREV